MYAIIKTGGKQYKVQKGDTILVELVPVELGGDVKFDEVFLINEGNTTKIGTPNIAGAVVRGKLLDNVRGKKIHSVKFKRRKNCRRKFGHRQNYSQVEITEIVSAGGN